MRKGLLAIVGPLLLAACQSSTSANEVQGHASQPSSVSELQQAHSSTSLCTGEQVAVISCKLETTGRIASLCAASSSDGVWKFRFLHGVPGRPATAVFPLHGLDDGGGFSRSRLMLFGGAGGLVYSTIAEGQRYALYSIQGKGFSRAGLQISPPGAEAATFDDECLAETLVEAEDESLLEAVDRWKSDPTFQDKALPGLEE